MASLLGFLGALADTTGVGGDQYNPGAISRLNNLASDPSDMVKRQQYYQDANAQQAVQSQFDQGQTDPARVLLAASAKNPEYLKAYAYQQAEQQKLANANPLATALASYNQPQQQAAAPLPWQQPQGGQAAPVAPRQDPMALQPESPDDKRNYDFLNTKVPPQYRAQIRAISNGDESVGNADSLRSNGLLTLATMFDPSISKTDFAARQATAKDFSPAGKSGQGLRSINTATKHLAQVVTAGLDLGNSDGFLSQPRNYIANSVSKINGADPTTNLKSTVQTVAPELAKAAASGGETTGSERDEQADSFGPSMSPTQLLGAAAGKVDLMQSKAEETANSFKNAMGRPLKEVITPENQQILGDIKALHGLAKSNKLNSPEAQPIIQRLRAVSGKPAPQGSSASPSAPSKVIKFGDLK